MQYAYAIWTVSRVLLHCSENVMCTVTRKNFAHRYSNAAEDRFTSTDRNGLNKIYRLQLMLQQQHSKTLFGFYFEK